MATPTKPKRRARILAGSAKTVRAASIYLDDRLPFARWCLGSRWRWCRCTR
ncbi:hypothetical protein EDD27_0596 [Nonomuraea polychroma]|uniref:Uncharacterized protein n=1 Tax=Nonomuraea polychroma TaxID=46176 RepID=A0A438LXX5_9ACTN|nr:hypothetical protein EDD27_0596 [Nonomuraea polychroma]